MSLVFRFRWISRALTQRILLKWREFEAIIDAGAVGINIEDGEGTPELLARKIEKARKAAESVGVNLFINARTDVYLQEIGSSRKSRERDHRPCHALP